MSLEALLPRRVLTPNGFESGRAVLLEAGKIVGLVPLDRCPSGLRKRELDGDLAPGFVDLQVNGGGGVLFNDEPSVKGIEAIARAHRRFGTTGLLPTLISDDSGVIARAIAAVEEAIERRVPGILGIHIEGPFLNPARKGIHDAAKLRLLDDYGIDLLSSLRRGRTMVTLAPELAPPGAVRTLARRGVVVAAGHTAATFEQTAAALAEGLAGFTHLYNAMSQLESRAPGAVGAALADAQSWCGIIADGHHVHPAALRVALNAKGPEKLALVTDAMPTVGSDLKEFRLGGRRIVAENGRCTDKAGTLAGSDLDMASAVRNAEAMMGVDLATALGMASRSPARAIGLAGTCGTMEVGANADLVLIDENRNVVQTWIGGRDERA